MLDQDHVLRLNGADAADLARLHPWLEAQLRELPERLRYAMGVALEEVILNVTTHAFPPGVAREIVVTSLVSQHGVELIVEDSGRAFDPTSVRVPARPASLREAEPGGLGLTLLRHYCEDVHYERAGERNRLTLRFPLAGN
jgi:serine/threonine-protein kinase RsbW